MNNEDEFIFDCIEYIAKDAKEICSCEGCVFIWNLRACDSANNKCLMNLRQDMRDIIWVKK